MRVVIAVGALNLLLGLLAFLAPLKFYSIASELFTPDISPPFSFASVRVVAIYLSLPAIALLANGVALVLLGLKLERVAELKVFSEEGSYLGRVKAAEMEEGKVKKFELEDKLGGKKLFKGEAIAAVRSAVILKSDAASQSASSEKFELENLRRSVRSVVENEFVGKEVYNQFGKYYGKVTSVNLDASGGVHDFEVVRGSERRVIKSHDVDSNNGVIIVRA